MTQLFFSNDDCHFHLGQQCNFTTNFLSNWHCVTCDAYGGCILLCWKFLLVSEDDNFAKE